MVFDVKTVFLRFLAEIRLRTLIKSPQKASSRPQSCNFHAPLHPALSYSLLCMRLCALQAKTAHVGSKTCFLRSFMIVLHHFSARKLMSMFKPKKRCLEANNDIFRKNALEKYVFLMFSSDFYISDPKLIC